MKKKLLESVGVICNLLTSSFNNSLPYDEGLCCIIEDILTHDLTCHKDKLWNLLRTVSHHSQNDYILGAQYSVLESMENLSSHAGFVRAWVRVTLNDGAICSALKMISEDDATKHFYLPSAFILDTKLVSSALTFLATLDKHQLNYVCNTVTLNQWRKENSETLNFAQEEIVQYDDSAGFNRRYSVGNRLSGCSEDDYMLQTSTSTSSSCTDIQDTSQIIAEECKHTIQISAGDSVFSENPPTPNTESDSSPWRNSQSDVRLSSISDLSNLPEEGSMSSLVTHKDTEERLQYFTTIPKELGISYQTFNCYSCQCVIGNQGQEYKVCSYDKKYYCRNCFGNYQHFIPTKLVYNWDHNKYRVSRKSFEFLVQMQNLPNIDISKLNISLYSHAAQLGKVRDYRTKLNMIREYLVRCSNKGDVLYETLRKKLGTHQYYWDTPHLYSITDLSKVFTGQLQNYLKKIVQKCIHHVYCCNRCTNLGFICEYCKTSKVIFAFELHTTEQCVRCSTVFHKTCKRNKSCLKCLRRDQLVSQRTAQTPT